MRSMMLVCLCGFGAVCGLAAEKPDKKQQAEELEAKAEAEAEAGTDNIKSVFSGTLDLNLQAPAGAAVIGTFVSEGKTYELKVANPEMRKSLEEYNKKKVTLVGVIRNKGKYFIAASLVETVAPPAYTRKRGGG